MRTRHEIPQEAARIMWQISMDSFTREEDASKTGYSKWGSRQHERYLRYKKLQYTGRLKGSIYKNIQYQGNRTTVSVGTNTHYAKVQNEGGPVSFKVRRTPPQSTKPLTITGGRVPARPFLKFGDKTEGLLAIMVKNKAAQIYGGRLGNF